MKTHLISLCLVLIAATAMPAEFTIPLDDLTETYADGQSRIAVFDPGDVQVIATEEWSKGVPS